jgi:mono/diheme cytochrome c family protein
MYRGHNELRGVLVFLAWIWPACAAIPPVTFTRDIAPILYKNCASCHRAGEVAPFPLLTYADAAKRASLIAQVTASRYMPPWKPEPGYGEFAGARGLTESEIETIRRWAEAGAPQGSPTDLPQPPASNSARLAHPDLIARMSKPFAIPAEGPDLYRCFVLPLGLDADRYVDAVEFRPGNPKVVHHAILFVDRSGAGRKLETEPGGGYPCFGAPGFLPGAGLGGWSPGSPPIHMPEGVSTVLSKRSDLVIQLHFHPTGKPEVEQGAVALGFTNQPPRRRLIDIPLGSRNIDIPPGERAYKVTDHFTLPVDVEAIQIIPHAHYICKEMRGVAHLPDGSTRWLIKISDWDFNWQEHYRYLRPVHLPADTRLEMEFIYDNSDANPHNPSHPPRRVQWGPDSTDEMAGLHINVLASRESDFAELAQSLWGKMMRSVGGGFFTLPEKH